MELSLRTRSRRRSRARARSSSRAAAGRHRRGCFPAGRGRARAPRGEASLQVALRAGRVPAATRTAPRTSRACRTPTRRTTLHRRRRALLETVAKVGRAASRDESRPVLTGILVRFGAASSSMAATDSYRLSVKETPLAAARCRSSRRSSRRARSPSSRGSPRAASTLELGVQENQVVFGVDGVWLTTRRIDGQFPNYEAAPCRRRSSTR